jgi:hypothetical protein
MLGLDARGIYPACHNARRDLRMENRQNKDCLQALAGIHEEICKLIFLSVPVPRWKKAIYLVQTNPEGDALSYEYVYVLDDGTELRNLYPETKLGDQIRALVRQQIKVTQQAKQNWFRMALIVSDDGTWSIDFSYRDGYEVGDVGNWGLIGETWRERI